MIYTSTSIWTGFIQIYMNFSCTENTVTTIQQKTQTGPNIHPAENKHEFCTCKVHRTKITMANFARINSNFFAFENVSVHSLAFMSNSKDTLDLLHFALCPEAVWLPMPLRKSSLLMKTRYNLAGERTEAWTALSWTKDFLSGKNSLRLAWVAGLTSGGKENPIPIVHCWWRALCSLNCSVSVCYLTPYTEWYISSPLPIFVFWQV